VDAPGDRPCLTLWVDEDEYETVTFAEFRTRATAQARMLWSQGVQPGDRVIVIMPQSIAAMTVFVGAMMLGAVPAFLAYPNFKIEASKYREGLAGVTANLSAKAVVTDDGFPSELLEHISLGEETRLMRASECPKTDESLVLPSFQAQPDDLAFIQHSAGTTGLQKGVALTHGAVLRQIDHLVQALEIDGTTDRIFSWLPLYHDMGLIACFILPFVCHVPVVMQSPLEWVMHPESMLQIISEFKCTLAWAPNFAFQFIPRRTAPSRWSRYDLSSLRGLINCSEPVRSSSLREFYQAFSSIGLKKSALLTSYAMAENVFAVSQSSVRQEAGPLQVWADGSVFRSQNRIVRIVQEAPGSISFVSSGRLLGGNEIRIVSDIGETLADGYVGEILLKSDSLFTGYYHRPDLTAAAIVNGWYHTGDLGFYLENELFVVGRKKDLLIVGGENLYPQDIEEIVACHTGIHDGRVVAMGLYNSETGTEDIVVVAEVANDELLAKTAQIEAELRRQIVEGIGIAVRTIVLKPPKWIVKSTAGKPARAATREKLLREHPSLNTESREEHFA